MKRGCEKPPRSVTVAQTSAAPAEDGCVHDAGPFNKHAELERRVGGARAHARLQRSPPRDAKSGLHHISISIYISSGPRRFWSYTEDRPQVLYAIARTHMHAITAVGASAEAPDDRRSRDRVGVERGAHRSTARPISVYVSALGITPLTMRTGIPPFTVRNTTRIGIWSCRSNPGSGDNSVTRHPGARWRRTWPS